MSRAQDTDTLIVGAGPVGLTTALLLAQAGVQTTIIEERNSTASRSYACGLHPHSLTLFERLGLLPEILQLGHRVDRIAFYDGSRRNREVLLKEIAAPHPFVVVLPQSTLETLLTKAIARQPGITLLWHHRLTQLQAHTGGVVATVDKLAGTSLGYIVPHWEMVVQNTSSITARYLVGADGQGSMVRRCLGIDYEHVGEPEVFAVFEFETDAAPEAEVRVVLEPDATSVLWPLPDGRQRWTFQLRPAELQEEFRCKGEQRFTFDDPETDRLIALSFQKVISERAPWFNAEVSNFDWVSRVHFERRLARQFGDGRCCLVGDAAHQTGPVGMQSFNVGLREAEELVTDLAPSVKAGVMEVATAKWNYHEGSPYTLPGHSPDSGESLTDWNQRSRQRWRHLLGLNSQLTSIGGGDPWVSRQANRILPCLPASDAELTACLEQLTHTSTAAG